MRKTIRRPSIGLKASEQGYAESKTNLAEYLLEGEHIKKDARRAVTYWTRQPCPATTKPIAIWHCVSLMVTASPAIKNKASNISNLQQTRVSAEPSAYSVACIMRGGCRYDLSAAIRWWERAADQLDEQAMHCLGTSYYFGEGVDHDADKALTTNSASTLLPRPTRAWHLLFLLRRLRGGQRPLNTHA